MYVLTSGMWPKYPTIKVSAVHTSADEVSVVLCWHQWGAVATPSPVACLSFVALSIAADVDSAARANAPVPSRFLAPVVLPRSASPFSPSSLSLSLVLSFSRSLVSLSLTHTHTHTTHDACDVQITLPPSMQQVSLFYLPPTCHARSLLTP